MPSAHGNGIKRDDAYSGSGLPGLLAQSCPSDGTRWTLQTPGGSRQEQCIPDDLRGMGRTDSPAGEYALALHTEDLSQLVRPLGLTQCVLGGVAIGGMITGPLALKQPEGRKGISSADSAAARPHTPQRLNPEDVISSAQSRGMVGLAAHMIRNRLLAPHLRENPSASKAYRDRLARNNVMGSCSGLRALSRRRDRTGELEQITVPALLMVGDRDMPCLASSKLMHRRMAGAKRVTMPGAGHRANIERPKAFNAAVLAFWETVPSEDDMPLSAPTQIKRRPNG